MHEVGAETHEHLEQVRAAGGPLGIGFLGVGFSPDWTLDETPRMPKQRYQVMTRYMPMVGKRGLDMMYRTATIQVNLDFADEADMVKKFRVSLALQPIATAIFACSPFTEGKPNGFLSMRSEVWRDTDRNRTGMLPFVFEPGMSFERYADYALGVPMYFVYRDGRYIDAAGASFARFPGGTPAAAAGRIPDRGRLVGSSHHPVSRGAHEALPRDARRRRRALAAHLRPAGILDRPSLRPHLARCRLGPRQGLDGGGAAGPAQRGAEVCAQDAVPDDERARDRARLRWRSRRRAWRAARAPTAGARTRGIFLEPVEAILRNGTTPAEEILMRYERDWDRQTAPLYREYAF